MDRKKKGQSSNLVKDLRPILDNPTVQDGPEDLGSGKVDQCGKVMYAGDAPRGDSVHKGKEKY